MPEEGRAPILGTPGNWEELEAAIANVQAWASRVQSTVQGVLNQLDAGEVILQATRANVPTTLTTADAGVIYYVTDFAHMIRWTGTIWESMGGGNRYIAFFSAAPGTGWALCDGSTVAPLVFGAATLVTTNVTLPNLNGTASYLKSASSYTGTIVSGAGTSGTGSAHTHTLSGSTGSVTQNDWFNGVTAGTGADTALHATLNETTHTHSVGTLAAANESSHTHGIGTLDPTHLNMLPYFRL